MSLKARLSLFQESATRKRHLSGHSGFWDLFLEVLSRYARVTDLDSCACRLKRRLIRSLEAHG